MITIWVAARVSGRTDAGWRVTVGGKAFVEELPIDEPVADLRDVAACVRAHHLELLGGPASWSATALAPRIEVAVWIDCHEALDELESGPLPVIVREAPEVRDGLTDPFPRLWELSAQVGWTVAGQKFDPRDGQPRLPVQVLLSR